MWAICLLAWCLFLASISSALFLDQKIIAGIEKDLPIERRPSLISLNGRAVARTAYRKHAAIFPNSKLRMLGNAAWAATVVTFIATALLISRFFGI
jgi:hypothetical protein